MKGLLEVFLVFLALSLVSSSTDIDDLEKTEEYLYMADRKALAELDDKTEVWIFPGVPPFKGSKAVLKYFNFLFTQGYYKYKLEKIQEYDMGTHRVLLYEFTVSSKTGEVTDRGTVLKFYERANGKPVMKLSTAASGLTPWPATTA